MNNPGATLEIKGNVGNVNDRNLKVTHLTGGALTDTEFSALAHVPLISSINKWTALYAKQGSASMAGVFEGDVLISGKDNTVTITGQTAVLDILGTKGTVNDRNFRVRHSRFATNEYLKWTELSGIVHVPAMAGGNGWTALYAKQGNASKAGVFDGDVVVAGKINTREVIVQANAGADFVFADDYTLRPLKEVEQFIAENKHLPEIAPADSMVQNGIGVSEMQIKLLQKIEELTLYMIEQEKRIERQQEHIEQLLGNTNRKIHENE